MDVIKERWINLVSLAISASNPIALFFGERFFLCLATGVGRGNRGIMAVGECTVCKAARWCNVKSVGRSVV